MAHAERWGWRFEEKRPPGESREPLPLFDHAWMLKRKGMTTHFHSAQCFEWPLPLVKLDGSSEASSGTIRAAAVAQHLGMSRDELAESLL